MAGLGVTAYRFSIAWPRVQPAGTGPANGAGLDFYDRLTDALLAAGITPVPTLYHWDLPQPLEDAGGWLARDTAQRFADYAALAAARLADRIPLWITLNEPFVVTAFGYALGVHAPGQELMLGALPTAHHQLLGHGLATAALRAAGVRQVMIANNYSPGLGGQRERGRPGRRGGLRHPAQLDVHRPGAARPLPRPERVRPGQRRQDPASGLACVRDGDLAVISAPVDGLGVNYYMPTRLSALPDSPLPFQMQPIPGYPVTSFGWPVVPAGLTEMLGQLAERYGRALPPLYITENGCAHDDQPAGDGAVDDQFRDRLHRRPPPRGARRDQRRRGRARLLPLDAGRQLRVGRGLHPAVRPGPRGPRQPGPHAEGVLRLVPRRDRGSARPGLTPLGEVAQQHGQAQHDQRGLDEERHRAHPVADVMALAPS